MGTEMPTSTLTLLALLVAQSAALPKLVVPDAPDVMIKTRRMIDRPGASVSTEVLYLKGARQRRESRVEEPPRYAATAAYRRSWIHISQCDERRTLLVNQDARTYAYEPITDPATYFDRYRAAAAAGREVALPETTGPTVVITTDAVDTGERRRFGHYIARHLITTRKTEPEPGAVARAGTDTQDGWYIDVPDSGCIDWGREVTFSLGFAQIGVPRDHVVFKQRGTARRGYPIEETLRMGDERTAIVTKLELVELSEAPLDPALFTVPPGYHAALPHPYGGYDLTKPDTLINRLESYRDVAVSWADYLLRNGLRGLLPGTQPAGY
jgi:hypothetical protein